MKIFIKNLRFFSEYISIFCTSKKCRDAHSIFIFFFLILCTVGASSVSSASTSNTFSLMINPAGDAQHTGRKLHDNFERGITMQCAQTLKKILEDRHSFLRVILTRGPGETVMEHQQAHFANRLGVNLYVSLHFYQESLIKPHIYMYTFACGQEFLSTHKELCFYPIDHAHLRNHVTTCAWATHLKNALAHTDDHNQYEVKGVYHVPFKPLLGIQAPAIALEIGLKDSDDWHIYIDALADALSSLIQHATGNIL